MTQQISVYDPTALPSGTAAAEAESADQSGQTVLTSLAGKVIGIIDNSKPNFENLANALEKLLLEQHGALTVRRHRKHAASLPAGEGVAADFADTCDLVITGSGD